MSSASTSAAVGSDGWAPGTRGRQRAGRARPLERRAALPALEQRHHQRGAERVAGRGAVHRVTAGGVARATSSSALEQHRALGSQRERDQRAARLDPLVLVAVDDRSGRALARASSGPRAGAAFRQKNRAWAARRRDHLERDLELAHHRVGVADLDVARASGAGWPPARPRSRSRRSRRPGSAPRRSRRRRAPRRWCRCPRARASAARDRRVPIRPTNRTRAPSRAAATAWLAPLPPGTRSNIGVGDRLAGAGQTLAAGDVVDVGRADDGDARRHVPGH